MGFSSFVDLGLYFDGPLLFPSFNHELAMELVRALYSDPSFLFAQTP